MIRAACTWLLIVLAASPFTAPFSTCDVGALLASRASSVIAPAGSPRADIAACSDMDDAESISPLVGRVVLSRDAVLALIDWTVPLAADPIALWTPASVPYGRALEDPPGQPLVLRL